MTDIARWAVEIAEARRAGAALLDPPDVRSVDQGYEIAREVAARLGEVAGWKVGATSTGAQRFLGIGAPIFGRVFRDGIIAGGEWRDDSPRAAEAEPEILVRVGRTPSPGEAIEIAALHIGLEINRPSADDALGRGAPFIVADNAAHVALVVGPPLPLGALDDPASVRVTLVRNGVPSVAGSAADVLGNPLEALRWLVASRAGSERPVRGGDLIATGAMCRSAELSEGDVVVGDFGRWGTVSIRRLAGKVMSPDGE